MLELWAGEFALNHRENCRKGYFNQLVIYLEENKLLHPNHHGGRKGHSTTTALVQMYNDWIEHLEEGHLVGIMR